MRVIVVVADDPAIAESLRAALPENDLVLIEPSVDAALRRMISIKADAAIVDDTPQLGRHALSRLREAVPAMPIVMLASRSNPETLAGFTLGGARACLPKPFSCEALRQVLSQLSAVEIELPVSRVAAPHPVEFLGSSGVSVGRHQVALRWLGRTSGLIREPLRLSQSLVDAVLDIFDTVRSAVLLEQDGVVRVAASHGIAPEVIGSLRLSFASGLMRWFEGNPCLIDRAAHRAEFDAIKEMQLLGARLAMPLLSGGRVCGAILVGDKATGGEYSLEERDLLTVMARSASVAIENAKLYRDSSRHQSRLDAILANITAGVVTVAQNKTISMMNQSAERILQIRAVDVLGRSVQKLGSAFADIVLRTLTDGQPLLRKEITDPAIDATLGLSATPLGAEGVVVIFTKLEEASAPPSELAYSPFWEYLASRVAQEIKNPMVAINTFAQLLPRKYASEDFRETFGTVVQKEVTRINSVVETLFDFARQPRLVLQRTNLNDTLRNALRSFDDVLAARNIKLNLDCDPAVAEADLDPVFFSQAVHNVVQNAIDAMPQGGNLTVKTKRAAEGSEVLIADSGPGVPDQDASLIFMPFFSTKEQGMGLGLTVANRIMQQHEGQLKLVVTQEPGGAFALSLPASKEAHANHTSG
ncbi:MAG: GAF domain-containing protein [Candidatus Hydrogenedentes bacterium]|nr:GAF domain-containing protein [Candidatus Hydrogenedentota bacterium]